MKGLAEVCASDSVIFAIFMEANCYLLSLLHFLSSPLSPSIYPSTHLSIRTFSPIFTQYCYFRRMSCSQSTPVYLSLSIHIKGHIICNDSHSFLLVLCIISCTHEYCASFSGLIVIYWYTHVISLTIFVMVVTLYCGQSNIAHHYYFGTQMQAFTRHNH